MIIKKLTVRDIKILSELATTTYVKTFGHTMEPEELESVLKTAKSEEYFCSVIYTDTILVAEKNKKLVGYIQLCDIKMDIKGAKPAKHDQAINAIYVHPDFQRQGIGKKLMNAAFAHPKQGATSLIQQILQISLFQVRPKVNIRQFTKKTPLTLWNLLMPSVLFWFPC